MTSIYRRTRLKKIILLLGALLILGGFVPRDSYAQSFGRIEADFMRVNGTAEIVAPEATAAVLRIYTDDGDDSGDKFSLNVSTADVFSIQNNGTAVVSVTTAGAVTSASTASFTTTLNVTGAEAGAATIQIWADEGDDTADKFSIAATAADVLTVYNNASAIITVSTAGATSIPELTITGAATNTKVLCAKSDGNIGECSSVVGADGTCTCG